MKEQKIKEIVKILKEELILYLEVLRLSKLQRDILKKENYSDGMRELVNKKDFLFDKIKEKEHILYDVMKLNHFKGILEIKSLLDKIKSYIKETLLIENECCSCVEKNKQHIYEEWQKLRCGKKIAQGYRGDVSSKNRFINIKK